MGVKKRENDHQGEIEGKMEKTDIFKVNYILSILRNVSSQFCSLHSEIISEKYCESGETSSMN